MSSAALPPRNSRRCPMSRAMNRVLPSPMTLPPLLADAGRREGGGFNLFGWMKPGGEEDPSSPA